MNEADLLGHIRTLVRNIQTTSTPAAAQKQLIELADSPSFLPQILTIITGAQEQEWVKTTAASFLSMLIANNAKEHTAASSKVIAEVIVDPRIKTLDKKTFEKALIKVLQEASRELREEWAVLIDDLMKQRSTFEGAYLIMGCFTVCDQIDDEFMRNLVQKQFEPMLSSLEICPQNANLLNEMMKMWEVVFDRFREGESNREKALFMAASRKLLDVMDLIYEMQAPQGLVVCITPGLYELNMLKHQTAQLHRRMLMYANQQDESSDLLYEYTRKNIVKMTQTLLAFADKQAQMDVVGCEDLLTTLFSIHYLYIEVRSEEYQLLVAIQLLDMAIFPYLRARGDERNSFEEDAAEFNALAEDCCGKQVFGILKTEAIKLMDKLADKIDGSLEYSISRAVESLKVKLGFIAQNNLQAAPLDIQTAFCILSVFSYGLGRFPQSLSALKVILCDERVKQLAPMDLGRIFIFMAYNYSEVFKNMVEGQSWISFAFGYKGHPTVCYCAFDFLSNLTEEYFNAIFPRALAEKVLQNNVPLLWDLVSKTLQTHYASISSEQILLIMKNLYIRLDREVLEHRNQIKNNSLDIVNCLHAFQTIVQAVGMDISQCINSNDGGKSERVMEGIWQLFEFLPTAKSLNLEDELVKISIEVLHTLPRVPPCMHPLAFEFIALFKKSAYTDKVYFKFLNQFIFRATFATDRDPLIQCIIAVKDAMLASIHKVAQRKKKAGVSDKLCASNSMLVMQNILALHGTSLLENHCLQLFDEVGSLCLRLLPRKDEKAESTSIGRILSSRALNTLLLCHMHMRAESIFDLLQRLSKQNLYHGYDTRVLVLCIGKQVFRQSDPAALSLLVSSMLQIVDRAFQKDEKLQQQRKKKHKKVTIASNLKQITDFDKILKHINSPFIGQTSIQEQLVNIFKTMKEKNEELMQGLIQSLPKDSLEILNQLVPADKLNKKRIIVKVIGVKQGGEAVEIQRGAKERVKEEMESGSESDEEKGPKRDRVKNKRKQKEGEVRNRVKVRGKNQHKQRKMSEEHNS